MSRSFQIIQGDVLDILRTLPDASFHGCLTDPPYGLSFMGKAWDHGVPGSEVWSEVLRVLKPGAMLLAFGGTRTHHRLMCAIEDAGFEIRDCLMWLYGSGFPKSLDIGKARDKQAGAERPIVRSLGRSFRPHSDTTNPGWDRPSHDVIGNLTAPSTPAAKLWDGYGTALKPAWEIIVLAMKPCEGTFAENALKWGVAGLAIDAGRIGTGKRVPGGISHSKGTRCMGQFGIETGSEGGHDPNLGRWPANVILGDEETAAMLDEQSGHTASSGHTRHNGDFKSVAKGYDLAHETKGFRNSGGASRFFYCAKADTAERHIGNVKNGHPTVKPIDLCAYLAKLLKPPVDGARLVVPFSGSGSEIIGALRAGWSEVVGIEREAEYVELSRQRIKGDAPMFNAVVDRELAIPLNTPAGQVMLGARDLIAAEAFGDGTEAE